MKRAQAKRSEGGYAMVALLVGMAILAIFMSVAMPVWRQANQREKEAELIWRGQQYDRAIQLFRKKFSAPGPPNLDILVQQRLLRKKYKDPIANAEFELKPVGIMGAQPNMPGMPGPGGQTMSRPGLTPRQSNETAGQQQQGTAAGQQQNVAQPKYAPGQLIGGVRSKSTAKSYRVLNGKTRYDQWEFTYVPYGTRTQGPGQQQNGQPTTSPRPGTGSTRPTPR